MTAAALVAAALVVLLGVRVAVRRRQSRALERVGDRWLDEQHGGQTR